MSTAGRVSVPFCTKCNDQDKPRTPDSLHFARDATNPLGVKTVCKDCDNLRKRNGPQPRPPAPEPRTVSQQADGASETAEDRAAEIGEKIGECAREKGVEPCDLTWYEFAQYADVAWGTNRLGIVRHDITRLGGFNAIRDHYFPRLPTDHAVTRMRLREQAGLNRRLGADNAGKMFVLEEMQRLSDGLFRGRVEPTTVPTSKKKMKRAIVSVISDTHFGSDVDARETGHLTYGRTEEARRLAQVVQQVCRYKHEHREETELHAVLAGDLIHGKLHDVQDGAARAEQKMRAIHLLSQAVAQFSAHFARVVVHCVGGNHDRDLLRHQGRGTSSKWDSSATEIYSSIRLMSERLPNVTFNIPLTPFVTFDLFGWRYFATHGDTVLDAGNPGKSVNTARIEAQINRWNASAKDGEPYSVFMMGHVHTPLLHHLANGSWLVVNGALSPADGYAVSIGLPETVADQVMFESTPEHPVGDLRFITLDRVIDESEILDEVIRPWERF